MKLYVATMDTGGISHGGAEYVAIAESPDEAREAIYWAWLAQNPADTHGYLLGVRSPIGSADELAEQWGIRVFGPMPVGAAVREMA